jgi:hypothetical protein
MRHHCLAHARDILDENMALAEQRNQQQIGGALFADDDLADVRAHGTGRLGHGVYTINHLIRTQRLRLLPLHMMPFLCAATSPRPLTCLPYRLACFAANAIVLEDA